MGLGEAGRIVDGVPIGINRKVSLLRSAFAALKWRVLDARTPLLRRSKHLGASWGQIAGPVEGTGRY
jgi:hypothetical protein